MKIADASTIRDIDRVAVEKYGISGLQLMENAGRGVAEVVLRELGAVSGSKAAIFAGKGNNGGDGYVAARHLHNAGIAVTVYTLCKLDELKSDAALNAASWRKMNGRIEELLSSEAVKAAEESIEKSDIVIDAIFGTGLSEEVTGVHGEAIRLINSVKKIISIDIPSGIHATTGAVLGEAVKAHVTATMAMSKLGLLLFPGRAHAGRVEVVDIGVPREVIDEPSIKWNLLGPSDISRILKPRKSESHKSSHGHLLVLAASPGMTGAAYMSGAAALRAGAGLVTVGVPESLHDIMEVKTTEVMTVGLPETPGRRLGTASYEEIRRITANKTALVVGPGAGTSEELMKLIELILQDIHLPVVIDADGLNSFAPKIASLKGLKTEVVLTPHPGEMSRLLNMKIQAIQADRVGAAEKLVELTGATVVLKGAYTVIACPNGQVYLNPTGNPGLATAGTGDILAGMLGAFLAQGYNAFEASAAAVYIHGLAGDEAKKKSGELGMIATDLLGFIPSLVNSFAGTAV